MALTTNSSRLVSPRRGEDVDYRRAKFVNETNTNFSAQISLRLKNGNKNRKLDEKKKKWC